VGFFDYLAADARASGMGELGVGHFSTTPLATVESREICLCRKENGIDLVIPLFGKYNKDIALLKWQFFIVRS